MSKTYEFVIKCVGAGDTPEEAWEDAKDALQFDDGFCLESVTEYTIIEEGEDDEA